MNKEELNQEISKLKVSLEAHQEQVKDLEHDLKVATQRLEDCDKPKLTKKQFELIHEAVESAIRDIMDSTMRVVMTMKCRWNMIIKYT